MQIVLNKNARVLPTQAVSQIIYDLTMLQIQKKEYVYEKNVLSLFVTVSQYSYNFPPGVSR